MEGREQRDPGYDDWFDEPEPPSETQAGAGRSAYEDSVDEVWVVPEDELEPRYRRRREIVVAGRTLTTAQAAIIVASALALLLAILAAAGVFNSGGKAPAPTVTTHTHPPAVTPPTSTPVTTPAAAAPTQTLSPGATGSEVKTLQRALTALGYSPGKADGDYGPSTQVAVEKFQAANGLAADGVVGQQTLAKLQQALSG